MTIKPGVYTEVISLQRPRGDGVGLTEPELFLPCDVMPPRRGGIVRSHFRAKESNN